MYIRFMIIYCVLDAQAIETFFCELPSHLRNHQNVIFHLKNIKALYDVLWQNI